MTLYGVPPRDLLKEAFGLTTVSRHGWIRYIFWSSLTLLTFLVSGGRVLTPLRFLGEELFPFDRAIRVIPQLTLNPEDLVPIALVEIDDATVERWGMTDVTPRRQLARALDVVTNAQPAAVVIDLDLSDLGAGGGPDTQSSDAELVRFLKSYGGAAPIILVRPVTSGADGKLRPSPDSLRAIGNARLSWAHALYVTDGDGTVRRWHERVLTCPGDGTTDSLPAVAVRALAAANWTTRSYARLTDAPVAGASCTDIDQAAVTHTVIYGARLTGPAAVSDASVSRLSAWLTTDSTVDRDDRALFQGRIVILGGTHRRANDSWRTPIGSLPGVELLANTVRFAAIQGEGGPAPLLSWESVLAIALFLIYLAASYWLRPSLAVGLGTLATAVAIWSGVRLFGSYHALDATETALLLFVQFSIFHGTVELFHETREKKRYFLLARRFWPKEPHA